MARVKGTILIDFIKTIKADKSGAYDAFLTDQDRAILSERILPSGWYPYETFKNCFRGAVEVLAKGDMDTVRKWGKLFGEAIITSVYRGVIREGEPMESLKKYSTYIRNLYDFGELSIEALSDHEAKITVRGMDRDFQAMYYMMGGWLERSLELCGAKDIKFEFISKSWEGHPETCIRLSWSK